MIYSIDSLKALHKKSSYHRKELSEGTEAHCFHCLEIYPIEEIVEWIDGDQTAICPKCGIDSVLPESVVESDDHLKQLEEMFFGSLHKI